MPGFDGTGPMGMGPMTGGGRGFCSPWGIRGARQGYGVPRRGGYRYPYYTAAPFVPGSIPYVPRMSREQELDFLKQEAEAIRVQLKEIESRMEKLDAETE